jgi:peptide/nickel transport system permease protein
MGGSRAKAAGLIGGGILAVIILIAAAAPLLFPGDPLDIAGPPLQPPLRDWAFPLGTDQLGRSVAAGLAFGARLSVTIGAVAAFFSLVVGIGIGTLAGFLGGLVDDLLMRMAEAVQTVPVFLLALAIVSVLGPTPESVVIAIAVASWPGPARLVRAEVYSLKARDFVAGCRAIGMSPLRIAFEQILPNALAPVIALSGILVASAILVESALSFLGLGDPNLASWGGMVAGGRAAMRTDPSLVALPGFAIAVTVVAVTLISDWLSDHLRLSESAS